MKIKVTCQDKYEAQKLANLIFIPKGNGTFITEILNVVNNELVLLLKDHSAHSVLLENPKQAESFVDFIQSVIEKEHKILGTSTNEKEVEIIKG